MEDNINYDLLYAAEHDIHKHWDHVERVSNKGNIQYFGTINDDEDNEYCFGVTFHRDGSITLQSGDHTWKASKEHAEQAYEDAISDAIHDVWNFQR